MCNVVSCLCVMSVLVIFVVVCLEDSLEKQPNLSECELCVMCGLFVCVMGWLCVVCQICEFLLCCMFLLFLFLFLVLVVFLYWGWLRDL